ncbi:hypothetical protein [Cetobacterium sp.]|uniref:hypothetical protein n=1 Tax=Cetobacterium sp. TaxID=2071632 RepID=UPI003EE44039
MKEKKILDKIAINSFEDEKVGEFLIEIFKKEADELSQWKKVYQTLLNKYVEVE